MIQIVNALYLSTDDSNIRIYLTKTRKKKNIAAVFHE